MRRELLDQSKFIKLLSRNGFLAYKVTASKAGVPDIEAIKNGIIYKFESKTISGKMSNKQREYFKIYHLCYLVIKVKDLYWYYGPEELNLDNRETKLIHGGTYENIKQYKE